MYTVSVTENIKIFFYFEPSFFLFVGKMSSFKFKSLRTFLYILTSGFVQFARSILSCIHMYRVCTRVFAHRPSSALVLHSDNLLFSKQLNVFTLAGLFLKGFVSASVGWSVRLRFVGIGYKVYFFQNLLVLKLGYSHYVIYLLPYELSVIFLGRKRRSIMLSCSDQEALSLVSKHILCLRIPNVYTGKGIRLRGVVFLRKEGKRSQF